MGFDDELWAILRGSEQHRKVIPIDAAAWRRRLGQQRAKRPKPRAGEAITHDGEE